MLTEKMENALNAHINAELYSAYMYYAMSAHFAAEGLPGCSHWMNLQVVEELDHAHRFIDYVNERGGRVKLAAIDAPQLEWESPLAVFSNALAHEQHVTSLINTLVDVAIAESDHATNNFLQWFVGEQVEEEASAGEIVDKMELVADDKGGLFFLDQELGKRALTNPPTFGA